MTPVQFYKLLDLVGPSLEKRSNAEPLSPAHRLAITLYYLAHGSSMQCVAWCFYVGKTTVSCVVRETCRALWITLAPIYLKPPTEEDVWLSIANGFNTQWNLPNCCGAIDGKHVTIQAPKKSGTGYFNYKKQFSIVLMAVCDSNYKFTLVDIGAYGSFSDGGVFSASKFGQAFENNTLNIPNNTKLPGSDIIFPHFIVGDEAFPLKTYMLRPYPGQYLNATKRTYNYRLSRARRVIENTFGIMVSRWRIFRNTIIAEVETAEMIVSAAVVLHNFLSTELTGNINYCPPSLIDKKDYIGNVIPGSWRREDQTTNLQRLGRMGSNFAARTCADNRNIFANYLENVNVLPWQKNYINCV